MKTVLLTMFVTCLTAVSMPAEIPMIYATHGEPFEATGFVLGYEGGNCVPPKFAYVLDSTDHRNKVWLCGTGSNEFALRMAMLNRGIYFVTGTLQQGAESPYVEVESIREY